MGRTVQLLVDENELVEIQRLLKRAGRTIRGDGQFIAVEETPSGIMIRSIASSQNSSHGQLRRWFPAVVQSYDADGVYLCAHASWNDGLETTSEADGGFTFNASDIAFIDSNEYTELDSDDPIVVFVVTNQADLDGTEESGADSYFFVGNPKMPSGMFAVNLTKTSGITGSNTLQCTWKYTVKTLDDVTTLGTVMSPDKQRPAVGKVTNGDGKVGLGYYDDAGDFVLYDANEVVTAAECT